MGLSKKAIALIIVAPVTIYAIFLMVAVVQGAMPVVEPGRYYCGSLGFSIEFPEGWSIQKEDGGATVVAVCPPENGRDNFYENVSVTVRCAPPVLNLEEIQEMNESFRYMKCGDFDVDNSGHTVLNGQRAVWQFYSYESEVGPIQSLEYTLKNRNRAYYISCSSEMTKYADYATLLDNSAHSFRFE